MLMGTEEPTLHKVSEYQREGSRLVLQETKQKLEYLCRENHGCSLGSIAASLPKGTYVNFKTCAANCKMQPDSQGWILQLAIRRKGVHPYLLHDTLLEGDNNIVGFPAHVGVQPCPPFCLRPHQPAFLPPLGRCLDFQVAFQHAQQPVSRLALLLAAARASMH
eukprot:485496-Pelagomonas_calceolata.AAC.4